MSIKHYFIYLKSTCVYTAVGEEELQQIQDKGTPLEVIGTVCDDKEFGDNCNTDCALYRNGTCPSKPMRDCFGDLWHVIPSKKD